MSNTNEFKFSPKRYLVFAGYKYFLFWLVGSAALALLMLGNNSFSWGAFACCSGFFFFVATCTCIGMILQWTHTTVSVSDKVIKYTRDLSGQHNKDCPYKARTKTYFIPFSDCFMRVIGTTLVAKGNICCSEFVGYYNTQSRKEYYVKSVRIPPYFSNWEHLIHNTVFSNQAL